jgi:hypothetical protein
MIAALLVTAGGLTAGTPTAPAPAATFVLPGHPGYYEGAPYNFVLSPPREGTFYYNDFNRYQYSYYDVGRVVNGYYVGATNPDYATALEVSGEAIIGDERGHFSGSSGTSITTNIPKLGNDTWRVTNPGEKRDYSGYNKYNGGSIDFMLDSRIELSPDLPEGATGFYITVINSSAQFYSNPQNGYARFSISTAGYTDVLLSLDLRPGTNSSANYKFMASVDGGANWIYELPLTNLTGTWYSDQFLLNLSSISTEFENNPGVVFQFLAIPDPEDDVYRNINGETTNVVFNLSIDRVNLSGTAIPEFATLATILASGGLGFTLFRRRKAL